MRRRDLLALVAGVTTLRPLAGAAQQKPVPVIGFLSSGAGPVSAPYVAAAIIADTFR
jgi:tetrahydromethanopterin S-methyltransferase subunit C